MAHGAGVEGDDDDVTSQPVVSLCVRDMHKHGARETCTNTVRARPAQTAPFHHHLLPNNHRTHLRL